MHSMAEGFAVRRIQFRKSKANSYRPSLPPLGEVPRSGKGGVVGNFELFPFNEPHPLSQAVRPASSPIGEPRGPLRIRPRFHKTITTCRRTPQSGPFGPASSPFRGAFLAAPFGGSAAIAAKGVTLVTLSCCHSTDDTPSVSPFGLPAPPLGRRGCLS